MPISSNELLNLKNMLNSFGAKLVAVSKTKSTDEILSVYKMGHFVFGENRIQELREKVPLLPEEIQWHAIGSLQTNKVKYIAPYISLIHSVDSPRLIHEIDKQAKRYDRIIPILLQIKIAKEQSKHGFEFDELITWLNETDLRQFNNVLFAGVMGMATFTEDMDQVRKEFKMLKGYFDQLKESWFNSDSFKEISMGMSGDYKIALEEGATLVRIGTLVFGSRMGAN